MKLRYAFALGLLLGLCSCAALAGSLGLAAADTLQSVQQFAHNKAEEVGARAQVYTGIAAAIAAAIPMAARYLDHKLKAKRA